MGCHGQTIYHQGASAPYLGKNIACTWQTGEGSVVAARLGVPVVSDFRPADMAAGGKGAPLVPLLDYAIFRSPHKGRIVQNIGGIANLTAIPAGGAPDDLIAFDTGPGNMVIDRLMQMLFKKDYDRGGAVARKGSALQSVLEQSLNAAYFKQKPPKTAGREEFGNAYAEAFLRRCGRAAKADVIATATALTARVDGAGAEELCAAKEQLSRLGGLRRRHKKCRADGHAQKRSREHGTLAPAFRRFRHSQPGQGSRGFCAAGIPHVQWFARKCTRSHGSEEARGVGKNFACLTGLTTTALTTKEHEGYCLRIEIFFVNLCVLCG